MSNEDTKYMTGEDPASPVQAASVDPETAQREQRMAEFDKVLAAGFAAQDAQDALAGPRREVLSAGSPMMSAMQHGIVQVEGMRVGSGASSYAQQQTQSIKPKLK